MLAINHSRAWPAPTNVQLDGGAPSMQHHTDAMRTRCTKISTPAPQRGMALIAALFLIVVLAMLGMAAVRIGGAQQQTVNLGLLGDRALAAANSGIQFSSFRTPLPGNCVVPNAQFDLTQGALAGFRVRVTCVPAGALHTFESTAFIGVYGSPDYVWRRVIVTR